MTLNPNHLIGYSWAAVGVVWLIGAISLKRTVRTQPLGTRLFHVALMALGAGFMASRRFDFGWLQVRFIPLTGAFPAAGAALAIAGCAFAIWARITLGSNWSGRATVKAGHELITRGPYALARHPIYTGLIAAILGSVLVIGQWRAITGAAIIVFAFLVKISQEERLMMQTFPEAYPLYRQRVKALLPGMF